MNNRPLLPTGCMTAALLGCIIIVFSILMLITVIKFSPRTSSPAPSYSSPQQETIPSQEETISIPQGEKLILKLDVIRGSFPNQEKWFRGRKGEVYMGQFIQYMPPGDMYVKTKGYIFPLGSRVSNGIHPSDVIIVENMSSPLVR